MRRLVPSLLIASLLLLCSSITGGMTAHAAPFAVMSPASANCGQPQAKNHCYAVDHQYPSSYSLSLFNGYQTYETVPNLSTNSGNFITDEMWLGGSGNWVEVGILSNGGSASLFWADARPGVSLPTSTTRVRGCSWTVAPNFCAHQGPSVGGSVWASLYLSIYKNGTNIWSVNAQVNGGAQIHGTSSSNPMSPSQGDIGMELEGTVTPGVSAVATRADYREMKYLNPTNNQWFYITTSGSPVVQSPPWGGWVSVPSAFGGPGGGDWDTCVTSTGAC